MLQAHAGRKKKPRGYLQPVASHQEVLELEAESSAKLAREENLTPGGVQILKKKQKNITMLTFSFLKSGHRQNGSNHLLCKDRILLRY